MRIYVGFFGAIHATNAYLNHRTQLLNPGHYTCMVIRATLIAAAHIGMCINLKNGEVVIGAGMSLNSTNANRMLTPNGCNKLTVVD